MIEQFKLRQDYRTHLPSYLTRFIGYRSSDNEFPHKPLPFPPFSWLAQLPLRYETWLYAWLGSFGGIMLIEAIMSTSTIFREVYHSPLIITSFGASAVLLFAAIESPLAQPRNFVLGHLASAIVCTAITRLWMLNPSYLEHMENTEFYGPTFVNGALCVATSVLVQLVIGAVHPPAGATGLNAAVQFEAVILSWRYVPVILASSLIMLGWALVINNLGRRRYPIYWWAPGQTFVSVTNAEREKEILAESREVYAGLTITEGRIFSAETDTTGVNSCSNV